MYFTVRIHSYLTQIRIPDAFPLPLLAPMLYSRSALKYEAPALKHEAPALKHEAPALRYEALRAVVLAALWVHPPR